LYGRPRTYGLLRFFDEVFSFIHRSLLFRRRSKVHFFLESSFPRPRRTRAGQGALLAARDRSHAQAARG
jgi:hypothetical protein